MKTPEDNTWQSNQALAESGQVGTNFSKASLTNSVSSVLEELGTQGPSTCHDRGQMNRLCITCFLDVLGTHRSFTVRTRPWRRMTMTCRKRFNQRLSAKCRRLHLSLS